MKSFDPSTMHIKDLHGLLLGAVGPRPIALASTINEEGVPNLSPFSFFNVFSANPPLLIFSPARRGADNTTKHTYENVKKVPEVVVNIVNYDITYQMVLSSANYPQGVNEIEKAGFTALDSDLIKPKRIAESPVSNRAFLWPDRGSPGQTFSQHRRTRFPQDCAVPIQALSSHRAPARCFASVYRFRNG